MTEARRGSASTMLLAIILLQVGVWHPYVVDVSPKSAASIGTVLGVLAAGFAVFG